MTVAAGSTSNRSYVATWAANAYTVCFHANDGSGATHGQGFFYDEPQSLDLVSARTGYGFSGWTANADGTGDTFHNGQVVSNLTAEATDRSSVSKPAATSHLPTASPQAP